MKHPPRPVAGSVLSLPFVLMLCACGNGHPAASTAPSVALSLFGDVVDTLLNPLADARVEVISGSGAGAAAVTDAGGRYSLQASFSGPVTIQASKQGFVTQKTSFETPFSGPHRMDFALEVSVPSVNVVGSYEM